jgi:DNA polymerase III epsilon subunit-like protein
MIVKYGDTETTGLYQSTLRALNKQPRIFEIYIVDDFDSECHHFLDPVIKIDPKASKATGVTNEMLIGKPLFEEVADDIKKAIEECDELWFHHASFDVQLIDWEFERLGRKLSWPKVRCSIEETEWLKGYRLNLTALHEELFGEAFAKAHTAKADVLALRKCVQELKARGFV